MRIVRSYSPLLGCEVWRLEQFACGKWFTCEPFSVFCSYHYADEFGPERNHLASRVRVRREAIREAIADYQHQQLTNHE